MCCSVCTALASQLASSLTLAMAYTSLANKRYSPGMLLARLSRLLLLARHLPPLLLPSPRRLPPLFLSTNHPLKTITRVEGQAILTLNLFCALLNMYERGLPPPPCALLAL